MFLKRIFNMVLSAVLIFSLSGCTNSNNNAKETTNNQNKNYSGTVNIWSIAAAGDAVKTASDSYKNKYPGIVINIKTTDKAGFSAEFAKVYASGGNMPDVLLLDDSMIPFYQAKYPDAFANITDIFNSIKNDVIDLKTGLETSKNIKHAVPWNNTPAAMYYRTDIYEKYGVNINEIITWDDFINAGKTILDKSGSKIKTIPLEMKNLNSTYGILLSQLGASSFDNVGRPDINSKESIKVLNLMKKISVMQINANADFTGVAKMIKNNSIASIPYSVSLMNYLQANISEQSGKWTVKKLPSFEAGGRNSGNTGGTSFLISDKSVNKDKAKEFVRYAVSDSKLLAQIYTAQGLFPSYKPAYSEELFTKSTQYFQGQKVLKLFFEISMDALPVNYSQSFDTIEPVLIKAQEKVFSTKVADAVEIKLIMDDAQLQAENQWIQDNIQLSNKGNTSK